MRERLQLIRAIKNAAHFTRAAIERGLNKTPEPRPETCIECGKALYLKETHVHVFTILREHRIATKDAVPLIWTSFTPLPCSLDALFESSRTTPEFCGISEQFKHETSDNHDSGNYDDRTRNRQGTAAASTRSRSCPSSSRASTSRNSWSNGGATALLDK
jgi:hypothetical protein